MFGGKCHEYKDALVWEDRSGRGTKVAQAREHIWSRGKHYGDLINRTGQTGQFASEGEVICKLNKVLQRFEQGFQEAVAMTGHLRH